MNRNKHVLECLPKFKEFKNFFFWLISFSNIIVSYFVTKFNCNYFGYPPQLLIATRVYEMQSKIRKSDLTDTM